MRFYLLIKKITFLVFDSLGLFRVYPCSLLVKKQANKIQSLINKLKPYDVGIDLIRLGAERDGGYLVPNDMDGISACFSPGVDVVSEFEFDCAQMGMQLFLADKSVDKPNLNLADHQYSFIKKYIGCTTNEDYITMDDWVSSAGIDLSNDLLLQMDIEGGEYFSIINMSDTLMKRFRIIVLEVHGLGCIHYSEFFGVVATTFDKILQTHTIVHLHPNNYSGIKYLYGIPVSPVLEVTFIRNDRIKQKVPQKQFPHLLDADNTIDRPHISLPKNWYS